MLQYGGIRLFYKKTLSLIQKYGMKGKWILKLLVQKAISYLPYSLKINYLMQKYITGGAVLDDVYMGYKIKHAADHIHYVDKYIVSDFNGLVIMELGTGWYPIIPLAFFLQNAKQVITTDLYAWMDARKVLKTIDLYVKWNDEGKLAKFIPNINKDRLQMLKDVQSSGSIELPVLLQKLNIKYLTGNNAVGQIPDNSVDLICSNNTLEHIAPHSLEVLLSEFGRIIKVNGLMSHFIDMTDHFSHFDNSISHFNFLKFEEWQWKLMDNAIQPQKRMRSLQYLNLIDEYKFITLDIEKVAGNKIELAQIKLAKPYREMSADDLEVVHLHVICKPK